MPMLIAKRAKRHREQRQDAPATWVKDAHAGGTLVFGGHTVRVSSIHKGMAKAVRLLVARRAKHHM
eukprot:3357166-Karenia_brevis.AAC.1